LHSQQYTSVSFTPFSLFSVSIKSLLHPILLIIIYCILKISIGSWLDVTKKDLLILTLGTYSSILIFSWKKLLHLIYELMNYQTKLYSPQILSYGDNKKIPYLPLPHLSNHKYWITKHHNELETKPKKSIYIFPTTLSSPIENHSEYSLFKLYSLLYTFTNPEKKMIFFVISFFTLLLLYYFVIFSFFIISTYIFQLFQIEENFYKIVTMSIFLIPTFGYTIYKYIQSFHLPFLDEDIMQLSNQFDLSKQFSVYYHEIYPIKSTCSPHNVSENSLQMKEELMQTINAILQVAIPFMFLSIITIFLALYQPKVIQTNNSTCSRNLHDK